MANPQSLDGRIAWPEQVFYRCLHHRPTTVTVSLCRRAPRMAVLDMQIHNQPTTHPRVQFCASKLQCMLGSVVLQKHPARLPSLGSIMPKDVAPGDPEAASLAVHRCQSSHPHACQPSQIKNSCRNPQHILTQMGCRALDGESKISRLKKIFAVVIQKMLNANLKLNYSYPFSVPKCPFYFHFSTYLVSSCEACLCRLGTTCPSAPILKQASSL